MLGDYAFPAMTRILPLLLSIAGLLLLSGAGLAAYVLAQPITDPSFQDLALRHSHVQSVCFMAFVGGVFLLVGWLLRRQAAAIRHPVA